MTTTRAPQSTSTQSSNGGEVVTVVSFVIAFAFFIGGMFLLGRSVSVTGAEFWVFAAGIVSCAFAYVIPMHILRLFDGA
ncbi:hypothetical protein FVP60_07370 [Microbacterium mitrae]|uniref:Uncharacterized protein n=1 Tax=Microbacterium mitrae TaxID=664640 RepID=A0A5C8HLM8_9MICO|nr:hypothetical protein [Microbacterium mitrae]TXK04502.1 hypothetical protein FVP60_07370 [Microbacterium mitrae]